MYFKFVLHFKELPCEIRDIVEKDETKIENFKQKDKASNADNKISTECKGVQTEFTIKKDCSTTNLSFSSILQRGRDISWGSDCEGPAQFSNSLESHFHNCTIDNDTEVSPPELFINHNSDISVCHSRDNNQRFLGDIGSRIKKTKKTVSWCDQVLGNSLANPDTKFSIKGKQYKRNTNKYNDASGQNINGKPKNKHNKDRRKKQFELGQNSHIS